MDATGYGVTGFWDGDQFDASTLGVHGFYVSVVTITRIIDTP